MSGPPQPRTPSGDPKTMVLSVYASLLLGAAVVIVWQGWPHPWVAVAILPAVAGVVVFTRAVAASRSVLKDDGES